MIVTHNILNEENLLRLLIRLNYEPFCTSTILNKLLISSKDEADIINQFRIVIISETVSDEEVDIILSKLIKNEHVVLRKCDEYLSLEMKERFKRRGFTASFEKNDSLDRVRELLKQNINVKVQSLNRDRVEDIGSIVSLSFNEKKIFDQIKKMNGEYISRKELCLTTWGKASKTQMSQLSGLVRKINYKLSMNKDTENLKIKTAWRQGYYLNRE